jgi:uncharacterized paraquat-inducible protein A
VFSNFKKIMMWFITTLSAILITVFCLSNRSPVKIDIWPFPLKQNVQLFVLLLACIGIGILWGGFATWLSAGTSRKKIQEAKRIAITAELNARQAEKRCCRLEQDLHDLRVQQKSTQYQI